MATYRLKVIDHTIIYTTHVVEASDEEVARQLVLQGEGEIDREEESTDFQIVSCQPEKD